MNWKTLSSKYLSRHIYFTAREDRCEMPNGTIVEQYFVVEMPTSVCGLALTQDGNVLLVKQYRHAVEETLLELPGGFVDKGESSEKAIGRELLEETGYEFSDYIFLARVTANPGVLNNYTDLYLATGGIKKSTQKLDYNEEIEIQLTPLEEVRQMLMQNEFKQALHTACLFYAFNKLDSLK